MNMPAHPLLSTKPDKNSFQWYFHSDDKYCALCEPCERVVCQTMALPDGHHPCLTSILRAVKVASRPVH